MLRHSTAGSISGHGTAVPIRHTAVPCPRPLLVATKVCAAPRMYPADKTLYPHPSDDIIYSHSRLACSVGNIRFHSGCLPSLSRRKCVFSALCGPSLAFWSCKR